MATLRCDPYAADAHRTCGGLQLPSATVNPYQPDAALLGTFARLELDTPDAVRLDGPAWPVLPLREETAGVVLGAPVAWTDTQATGTPVPEPALLVLCAFAAHAVARRLACSRR